MKNKIAVVLVLVLATVHAMAGGYKVGDVVQDFNLKNIDGRMVSLNSNPNVKGYIIVFTCNHCPYAKAYEDRIIALHKTYAEAGYPVIAINPNDTTTVPEDSWGNMITRAHDKGFPFPYLIDPSQDVAKAFGATRTPHVFLVQKSGNSFVVRYIGAIDDNADDEKAAKEHYVANAISSLNKGSMPSPDFVKAVGCSIKWAKK